MVEASYYCNCLLDAAGFFGQPVVDYLLFGAFGIRRSVAVVLLLFLLDLVSRWTPENKK